MPGGWVRGPVGKKGYMVQANTLDLMWKGSQAVMSNNPVAAGQAAVALTTGGLTGATGIPDAQILTPVAGTLIFGVIQNFFPGIITISTGFGAALLAVGGVSYLLAKWDEEGTLIEKYAYVQAKAWEAYTAATGVTLDQVVEYYMADDVLQSYASTGGIKVSRPITPFEPALEFHPDQGVDIPPQSAVTTPFEQPLSFHPDQTWVTEVITGPEAQEIVEELIEAHEEIKETIKKNPHPDYIKPEILDTMKSNTFNKGLLAPIALFILIIFFKRRKKKR